MNISIQKAVLISLLLHLLLIGFLWLTIDKNKIQLLPHEHPVAIAIALPSEPAKSSKAMAPPQATIQPEKPQPVLPIPTPPKTVPKPAIKKTPVKKIVPKTKAIIPPTPEYKAAMEQLDKLPIEKIPTPFEVLQDSIKSKKTVKIAKKTQKPQETEEELGAKYAAIIGTCIKSKIKLIALGAPTDFNIIAHFYLNKNGILHGTPEIKAEGGDERQKNIAINQATLALKSCSPFNLPIDKYDIWKEVNMTFSPVQN